MMSASKEKYIIGINAYNIRAGGGITHLSEILNNLTFNNLNIGKIILWAPELTLSKINKKPWLLKVTTETESKSFLSRYKWLLFNFKSELFKYKIDILLVPGGTYLGSFRPFITINQNLLPFESKEISRYGLSFNFFKFHFLMFLQKKTNRNADGIIFLTKYAMKKVLFECNLENKKSIIIPHGVSSRFNHSPSSRNFIDFKEFTKEFPCKILYISSIELYKHQWVVIDAINFLHENGYKVKLTLVGPHGSGSKKLEKKMQSINPEIVEYLGTASYDTIEKSYVNADIGIFASSCETFGMILTEAMSCGLPVAASNMSAIPDVLSDSGLYFNPENSDEIADAIKKLILSSDLRRELANKGYEHVKKFNWINSSNETFCFIEEILMNYKKTI